MITYHFDLYPRDDPRDGARVVRFTKLQSAEYRGEANGTGAGRISLRADTADAQFIDPAGLQYVRVVRDNGSTEVVVGGFFLDSGDFSALDETGTRLLKFGGAGTLSYLSRAIMASHTYLDFAIGTDPYDDTWRLYAQGPAAGGDFLGTSLWRTLYEAQHFRVALTPHRHTDGVIYTDSHDDDRTETAIPDAVLTFDGFDDSNGNAWTVTSGEFKAQIGENVLEVVRRLMAAGLYVSMDPDTFEVNAYPAATHRRDRTGAAWGASVIRFQSPTGGDKATGNIKSDARRAIAAFIKRSWLLAGGQNVYGDATGTTDIPWEGFYHSDISDATAAAGVAAVQIGARDDAGDTVRLRFRSNASTPASGYYLPFEDILLDDLVTVHTGATQWDFNEQDFPVAAITIALRSGGDWDAWVDLGSSYAAGASRQFQVAPVPGHNHLPNPELCRPVGSSAPTIISGDFGGNLSGLLNPPVGADALLVLTIRDTGGAASGVSWNGVPMTAVPGSEITHDTAIPGAPGRFANTKWWYATNDIDPGTPRTLGFTGTTYWGYVWVAGFASVGSAATNKGVSAAPSVSLTGSGGLALAGVGGFAYPGTDGASPTIAAPGVTLWGLNDASTDMGVGYGDPTAAFTLAGSRTWVATAVWLNGAATASGDGRVELIGTSVRAKRCDDTEHYHTTGDPTVNDDTDAGFRNNTLWINETSGAMFLLLDNVAGAADWLSVGGGVDLSGINFLVGTASGDLSNEIVVGTTPGGELGGTWASPTVDATHSGSAHHTRLHAITDALDHSASGLTAGHVLTATSPTAFAFQAPPGVTAAELVALGVVGPLLIADDHSTPLVFADLLQTEEGDDLLYADIGA